MDKQLEFCGTPYVLNQCEDIWRWFSESKIGEYTHYYDKVIFHKTEGFYAAYANNLLNGVYV